MYIFVYIYIWIMGDKSTRYWFANSCWLYPSPPHGFPRRSLNGFGAWRQTRRGPQGHLWRESVAICQESPSGWAAWYFNLFLVDQWPFFRNIWQMFTVGISLLWNNTMLLKPAISRCSIENKANGHATGSDSLEVLYLPYVKPFFTGYAWGYPHKIWPYMV